MPKPRIAVLHYSAPPNVGGVESTLAAHARLFAQRGYAIKVVAGCGELDTDARVEFMQIPELDSRHPRVQAIQSELNAGRIPAAFETLTDSVQRALDDVLREVDVCLAHNVVTLHKNLALTTALHRLARTRRVRLIAWCHDFAWDDPVYVDDMHSGSPWDLLRTPWHGVKYVVVSEARRVELARLLHLEPESISVVPPGIDPAEFFGFTPTSIKWTEKFDLLGAAPLLLLPARVTRRKNIELAIDITAALRDAGQKAKLVVMGPLGPHNPANRAYLNELKAHAARGTLENAVIFLQEYGAVSNAERRDLYALADALLFPSLREGFGIPILEAGLMRLPIFCSDIPPFRESAGDLANYFGLDEPAARIAGRLIEFLATEPRYRLKRRVLENYTWERIFDERIEPLLPREVK